MTASTKNSFKPCKSWRVFFAMSALFASVAWGAPEFGLSAAFAAAPDREDEDLSASYLATQAPECAAAQKAPVTGVVYVARDGSDSNSGQHLATLNCALQVASKFSRQVMAKVTIMVGPGEYTGEQVLWTPSASSPEIVIQPATGARPRFNGGGNGAWLTVKAAFNQLTPLTVTGMEVVNYQTAVSLDGRNDANGWNGGVKIVNNRFANIGSQLAGEKHSTAAIRFVNSRNNLVQGNQFVNIRNSDRCGALHSVYMAHFSSHNAIRDNSFDGGCGDPIKVRDQSNDNLVANNTFRDQQVQELFLDSFCNQDVRSDCTAHHPECPSTGNQFTNNKYLLGAGETPPASFTVKQTVSVSGCAVDNPQEGRIRESGTIGARQQY